MDKKKIIEKLRDDTEYYHGLGKEYFSASSLKQLLKEPGQFGVTTKETENVVPKLTRRGLLNLARIG